MSIRRLLMVLVLVVAAALVLPRGVSAAVKVGDTPALGFKATDGAAVSLAKLKGRVVVVDFWATWCPPCMALAGEMVEINKTYGPKGLSIVGVSLDQNRAALDKVCREKGFTWPQYFDGKGWDNEIWKDWGEDSVPFSVVISPDGAVLWKGDPGKGALKAAIEKAFREHPPKGGAEGPARQ